MRTALATICLLAAGCASTDAAVATARVAAAGNDRYTQLAADALAGKGDPRSGLAPVTSADLARTPPSVKTLTRRLLEALHTNRHAWRSTLFQLGEGEDPQGLDLRPLELPRADGDLIGK